MHLPEKTKVLIAEDNPDIGELIQLMLTMEGIEAEWVIDGEEALKAIEEEKPSILLTDIDMPRKDGITLIENIRTQERIKNFLHQLPIIAMSAGEPEKLSKAILCGATASFRKSFDFTIIIDKIKELLQAPLTMKLAPNASLMD